MTETTRDLLRRVLSASYGQLRRKLKRKLGSDALASEVLHETWIRLGKGRELEPVANPEAYVYRAALNTAHSLKLADERAPHALDLTEPHDLVDEQPGPDLIVEGHDEIRMIGVALTELIPRQRDAFVACVLTGEPIEEVAARHSVTVRTIQADIRTAILHCAQRTGRKEILADRTFRVSRIAGD